MVLMSTVPLLTVPLQIMPLSTVPWLTVPLSTVPLLTMTCLGLASAEQRDTYVAFNCAVLQPDKVDGKQKLGLLLSKVACRLVKQHCKSYDCAVAITEYDTHTR